MNINPMMTLAATACRLSASAALLVSALALHAAPLSATAAAHVRPDETSPVLTVLAAGTTPAPATDALATTPAGWMAVELPGPFDAYVQRKDLLKSLDVKPGASLYHAPDLTAGVIATAEKGDSLSIIGLHGKWTQVRLDKKLTGYVHVGGVSSYLPPIATAPAAAPVHVATPASAPVSPSPVNATAYGVAAGGAPAPTLNPGGGASLPRSYQGKFASTRSPFHPRRPFDWALNDDAGKRIAYLDTSHLLLTEQIESYAGHDVVVYGETHPSPDGKDFVIVLESLQLK